MTEERTNRETCGTSTFADQRPEGNEAESSDLTPASAEELAHAVGLTRQQYNGLIATLRSIRKRS